MKLTNIAFEVAPEEAQSLHDFLVANGILCPGPRYDERVGVRRIIAVNWGTDEQVQQARALVKEWRSKRGDAKG